MRVKDPSKWKQFQKANAPTKDDDPGYGQAILTYAERWARSMEAHHSDLRKVSSIAFAELAERTSHEADLKGITGFMYGAAVATLRDHWEYGDLINEWHNAKYGKKGAKGTVNPAVVTVGK